MRAGRPVFGFVVAAFLSALAGCNSPGDDPGKAVAIDPGAMYAQMCARCHGMDGKGNPEIRKTMPVRDLTDPAFQSLASTESIAAIIMAGKGQMPPFGRLLSRPKVDALAGYVKRLGRSSPGHSPAAH